MASSCYSTNTVTFKIYLGGQLMVHKLLAAANIKMHNLLL